MKDQEMRVLQNESDVSPKPSCIEAGKFPPQDLTEIYKLG
jgi:hypothetical protein